MNRKIKILSIIVIASGLFVIYLFFVALKEYNYNILTTLKEYWVMFSLPLVSFLLLKREKNILNFPVKKINAKVVYVQRKWVPIRHRHYLLATFELPNKTIWTFRVPVEIFNELSIGQHGILSYREKNSKAYFVFFTSIDNVNNTEQA